MVRKGRKYATSPALLALYLALPLHAADLAEPVRLPAIYYRWPPGSGKEVPSTTIEQVHRCMGVDSDLSRTAAELNVEFEQVDKQMTAFKAQAQEMSEHRARVESEQKSLAAELG